MILLNPGPVTLSPRVREALLRDDLCHREPEFAELSLDIRARLERIYLEGADAYAAVLLTGSGTAAVISPVGSLNFKGENFVINDFKVGPVTEELYTKLLNLQYGKTADPFGWVKEIGRL